MAIFLKRVFGLFPVRAKMSALYIFSTLAGKDLSPSYLTRKYIYLQILNKAEFAQFLTKFPFIPTF